MVEVVATHLLPRRQHLLDPAQLLKGTKGGLAEPQQGLVDAVQGVQLPGLAHVYRHMYRERTAAAAASAASAGAAAAAAAQHGRGVFAVHRFLRPSLQLQQDLVSTAGAVGGGNAASLTNGPESASYSGSLAASSQGQNPGSVVGRLGSLLARSFSQASGRRSSVTSVGSGQGSRPGSTGGAVLEATAEASSGVDGGGGGAGSVEGVGHNGVPSGNGVGSAAGGDADKGQGVV
jgi:hypothetical protein